MFLTESFEIGKLLGISPIVELIHFVGHHEAIARPEMRNIVTICNQLSGHDGQTKFATEYINED